MYRTQILFPQADVYLIDNEQTRLWIRSCFLPERSNQMTNSGSYAEVLKQKGVQPFLWTQFLNAFNDNVYKLVVSLLAVLVATNKTASRSEERRVGKA